TNSKPLPIDCSSFQHTQGGRGTHTTFSFLANSNFPDRKSKQSSHSESGFVDFLRNGTNILVPTPNHCQSIAHRSITLTQQEEHTQQSPPLRIAISQTHKILLLQPQKVVHSSVHYTAHFRSYQLQTTANRLPFVPTHSGRKRNTHNIFLRCEFQ